MLTSNATAVTMTNGEVSTKRHPSYWFEKSRKTDEEVGC
jgi:hypothetical protein